MSAHLEFVANHAKPKARVSVILLDWNVRESFHSLHYLNDQTVDRSLYELIWIEFYERKPASLIDAVRKAEAAGRPIVDKLVVMNHPRDVIFHKHRMYNLGIVLSEGEICVICDSDAMFTPRFIEKIIAAFEQNPQSVVHLDEVRNVERDFYPFNYPTFQKFLETECPNWTGRTTWGLDNSKDMVHEANYGACMAARRSDIIRIGGADEHLDYLGYICGPYDLTFRLVNAGCRERWLTDEFLYHTWHPGESGINVDYHGPSDGRGMSQRSLTVRSSGEVEPGLENGAIRALRKEPLLDRRAALACLESPSDAEWREVVRISGGDPAPRLVQKAFRRAFDIYLAGGCWYAILTGHEMFDVEKYKSGYYLPCLRANARDELERMVDDYLRRTLFRRFLNGSILRSRRLRRLPLELARDCYRAAKKLTKACLGAVGFEFDRPYDPVGRLPQMVRQRFLGHNIVHYRKRFYAIPLGVGAFDPSHVASASDCPYLCGNSIADVKSQIRVWTAAQPRPIWTWRRVALLRYAARLVRPLLPDALVAALRGRAVDQPSLDPDTSVITIMQSRTAHELRRVA